MPKLVFALESDYQGPMCLNDDNTLGITNFAYSEPYKINGLDYIDEVFVAPNGSAFARVLFINSLEAPQELSSQRHYYKLAEVIQYPAIPNLVITAVHDQITFNPWILQNWIIARDEQDNINREQWLSIQGFMQHQYPNEPAALNSYQENMEMAKTKRELQEVKFQLKTLETENAEIKAKIQLVEEQLKETTSASVKKLPTQSLSAKPKLSKAQKQKNRRDDILLKASRIAALAIMVTKTYSKILDLLRETPILNTQDRIFFTNNLNISINSCGYILNKLHKRTDVSPEVKLAFLYKLDGYSESELSEYTKNNPAQTQNLVTMAVELGADAALRTKIQTLNNNILTWNNHIKTVKKNQVKLLDEMQEHFKSKKAEPELLLQQSILDLNSGEFLAIINNHAELNKKSTNLLKTALPLLSSSDPIKLKQFLESIKLSKDFWRDIYNDDKISGTVKTVAQQWADTEVQAIFESITRKIKPVKIPKQLLHLFNDKTTDTNQTLLMLAFAKAYPDDMLEQIFTHAPGNLLTMDWDDQTLLHYMARYKGGNYELIRRIRDAFIKAVEDARQHFPETIQAQSDKDGSTFLHCILQGENEEHACKMMRLFLTDEALPTQLRKIFCTTIFARNSSEETVSIILDSKNVEWGSARQLIHSQIHSLMFDYEFPDNYGSFFLSDNSAIKFIGLAINDPQRLIDILDARANLQITAQNRMRSLLEKTPKDLLEAETKRLSIAMTCFNYGSIFGLVIPGTGMNIHRALAQKICAEYDTKLEKKYNNSTFYKVYTCIEFRDNLIWSKFTHAFRVWAVSMDESPTTPHYKNLKKAAMALTTYVTLNNDKIPDVVACFFDLNESPSACALFIDITTRNNKMENLVYSEFFKFKDHHKFTSIFKYLAKNLTPPAISIFARQVMQFTLKKPTNFGLLLQLLAYNHSKEVTYEFMEQVCQDFGNYDNFLAAALDNDSQLLICNLLSQRDPVTGRATMDTLCRVAIRKNDFEPLYKMLGLIKSTKHKNWDPEADFIQYMLGNAAERKDLQLVETIITRCNPKITAGVILAVSDSEKNNSEPVYQQIMKRITDEREKQLHVTVEESKDLIVEIKPNKILQRPKIT